MHPEGQRQFDQQASELLDDVLFFILAAILPALGFILGAWLASL